MITRAADISFDAGQGRAERPREADVAAVEWTSGAEYDRLGLEQESMNILGAELPHAVVPVRPGRNMTTIVEVAARNHLLKLRGHHSAQEFAERLSQATRQGRADRRVRDQRLGPLVRGAPASGPKNDMALDVSTPLGTLGAGPAIRFDPKRVTP